MSEKTDVMITPGAARARGLGGPGLPAGHLLAAHPARLALPAVLAEQTIHLMSGQLDSGERTTKMEYKVLSGPFNAAQLERDLNSYAAEG